MSLRINTGPSVAEQMAETNKRAIEYYNVAILTVGGQQYYSRSSIRDILDSLTQRGSVSAHHIVLKESHPKEYSYQECVVFEQHIVSLRYCSSAAAGVNLYE